MAHTISREQFDARCKEEMESNHPDKEFVFQDIENSRGKYSGLVVRPKEKTGKDICPVINLDNFWEEFSESDMEEDDFTEMIFHMDKIVGTTPPFSAEEFGEKMKDYSWVKSKLYVSLMNQKKVPSGAVGIPIEDLFLCVRCAVDFSEDGFSSCVITDDLVNMWNLGDAECVIRDAADNSPKILPSEVRNLVDLIPPFMRDESAPKILVVSNDKLTNGAGALFYEGMLQKISDEFGGGDFFCLPSSINEWICVSSDMYEGSVDDARNMVRQINSDTVSEKEWLSDEVYKYDHNSGKFVTA